MGEQKLVWLPSPTGGEELVLKVARDKMLDLHLASSAIKQISSLLLWMRYGRESFLIIDEPELNLHPIAQAQVLEALALLVRSGVHVLITTHSAELMAHLNNLISGHADPKVRKRQGRLLFLKNPEAFLSPEEVGAYQLEGGVLTNLYDPDYGIRRDTLSVASEQIYRMFYDIKALEPKLRRKKAAPEPAEHG